MLLRLGDASPEDGGAPQLAPMAGHLAPRPVEMQARFPLPWLSEYRVAVISRPAAVYMARVSSAWASKRAWVTMGVCPSALAYADSIAMTQTIGEPLGDDGADAGAVAVPIYPVIRCMRISHRC
jgi:hypothetical protein